MNYQNSTIKTIFILLEISLLISCNNSKTELRLVFANKVNYESFIIAKQKGYFNEAENNISIQTVNSGIQAAEAFTTGSADIIGTGNGPAVILMSKNSEIRILTRYATGEKMHRLIADTSIHTFAALKGKRIGIQQGSSTHAALLTWLHTNNISLDSVSLIAMEPANMPEAMKNKQLDAIAGSEPWALNVEKLCGNTVYELSNLYDKNNSQSHVLVSTAKISKEHKQQIEAIINGLEKANKFIKNNPKESAEIVSKSIGLTVDEQMLCTSRLNWSIGWEATDEQSLAETAKTLFQLKKISEIPKIKDFISSDFK